MLFDVHFLLPEVDAELKRKIFKMSHDSSPGKHELAHNLSNYGLLEKWKKGNHGSSPIFTEHST